MSDIEKEKRKRVVKEFSQVINKNSLENLLDMPDFIMAEMVVKFLENVANANAKNKTWHQLGE